MNFQDIQDRLAYLRLVGEYSKIDYVEEERKRLEWVISEIGNYEATVRALEDIIVRACRIIAGSDGTDSDEFLDFMADMGLYGKEDDS